MRVRWFGEPWPDTDMRAPICESDDDRVPTPVGYLCEYCRKPIQSWNQGVILPYHGPMTDNVTFMAVTDDTKEGGQLVIANHLDCMLKAILGP